MKMSAIIMSAGQILSKFVFIFNLLSYVVIFHIHMFASFANISAICYGDCGLIVNVKFDWLCDVSRQPTADAAKQLLVLCRKLICIQPPLMITLLSIAVYCSSK